VWRLNLKFIGTFTWYYGFKSIPRGPSYIISSMMYPLVFLFLITIFSAGKFLDFAVIGGFISIVGMNAIYSSSDMAFHRIQLKTQDLFVATSISSTDYALAMSFSYLATSTPGIAVYAIIGVLLSLFTLANAAILAVLLLLVLFSVSAIAVLVSGMIKHIRNVWGISGILSVLLTVLPPIFYPYSILPKPVLYLFMLSPVTPASMLAQAAFKLQPFHYYAIVVLLVEIAVYAYIAKRLNHWREK
jgi:ABC-2 type transport system permease protein